MPEQLLDAERGVVSLGAGPGKRTATILSVAAELPEGRLTTAELAERFGITEEWIISRTGIRERCRAAPDERLTDYAIRAGGRARWSAPASTGGARPRDRRDDDPGRADAEHGAARRARARRGSAPARSMSAPRARRS